MNRELLPLALGFLFIIAFIATAIGGVYKEGQDLKRLPVDEYCQKYHPQTNLKNLPAYCAKTFGIDSL